jgi:hypothetical protein
MADRFREIDGKEPDSVFRVQIADFKKLELAARRKSTTAATSAPAKVTWRREKGRSS